MIFSNDVLITDLYQLTMAAGYWSARVNYESTFELFIRQFPLNRSFLIASGINECLDYLINLKFTDDDIEYLKSLDVFKTIDKEFFVYLRDFKFTGSVNAIEEGTIFFPNEPVISITAPIIEAQIVETFLLSMFNFQTSIASKAARIALIAKDKLLVEFGTRRAHSPYAGVLAAKAAFVGGFYGTSNVLANKMFDIPCFGTMAHSWIMNFETEKQAFDEYSKLFPTNNTLLIDTYDTIKGAEIVAGLEYPVSGVRLDSGDIEDLSKKVRLILNDNGKKSVKIIASGDLNEFIIDNLLKNNAPVDIFGVGTELVTSKDAPSLAGVYKLVEQKVHNEIRYKQKLSENKKTYPGKKQIFRFLDNSNKFAYDIIGLEEELENNNSFKLLKVAILNGCICQDFDMNLVNAKNRCLDSLKKLPDKLKDLYHTSFYKVEFSQNIKKLDCQSV